MPHHKLEYRIQWRRDGRWIDGSSHPTREAATACAESQKRFLAVYDGYQVTPVRK